jgi:hypothetical protein
VRYVVVGRRRRMRGTLEMLVATRGLSILTADAAAESGVFSSVVATTKDTTAFGDIPL